MDITEESPRILSLCSGYGGIELGLKRVFRNLTVLAYVEIEAFAVADLVDKMEAELLVPAPVWTDIKTFRGEIFRGRVDILTGGYPCQPFSCAGKRKGIDDPRHLWPYILRCIRACRPSMVFFENVEGHLSLGISEVLSDLEGMGFEVEVGLFSAEEVGAPHRRKRVFILGYSRLFRSTQHEIKTTGLKQSGCELGNSHKSGLERRDSRIVCECSGKQVVGKRGSSEELGNSESDNERGLPVSSMHGKKVKAGRSGSGERKLGDSEYDGSSETKIRRSSEKTIRNNEERKNQTGESEGAGRSAVLRDLWPARPGEEQYAWEEPRTVMADPPSCDDRKCHAEKNGRQIPKYGDGYGSNRRTGKTES